MKAETTCSVCGGPLPVLLDFPLCPCGGTPRLAPLADPGSPRSWASGPLSLWRYASAYPLPFGAQPVTLGEGFVSLEPLRLPRLRSGVWALRDDLQPTGSWKDRGSALLITALVALGKRELVEDSSGNAALSLARYASAAGLVLDTFVPESATPVKKDLIRAAGARLVEIPGHRQAATDAARAAAGKGKVHASHALQPLHAAGAASAAFNIYEHLGRMPGAVVLAAGQGGYLAAVHAGFAVLSAAGHGKVPRVIGVQSAACAPLARAFEAGRAAAEPWKEQRPGLAEGVLIPCPARDTEALAAARASGGAIVTVDDLALDGATRVLWREGFRVEPTAALPVAWLLDRGQKRDLAGVDDVVVLLSGHGVREGKPLFPGLV